jgi:hypothetical protein
MCVCHHRKLIMLKNGIKRGLRRALWVKDYLWRHLQFGIKREVIVPQSEWQGMAWRHTIHRIGVQRKGVHVPASLPTSVSLTPTSLYVCVHHHLSSPPVFLPRKQETARYEAGLKINRAEKAASGMVSALTPRSS